MDSSCKRCCCFLNFIIFGAACLITSYTVSDQNDDQGPFYASLIVYGILFFTSVRYQQRINECQRYCSGIIILIIYVIYWWHLVKFSKDLHDSKLYIMMFLSGMTALSDLLVFTSYFYEDTGSFIKDERINCFRHNMPETTGKKTLYQQVEQHTIEI